MLGCIEISERTDVYFSTPFLSRRKNKEENELRRTLCPLFDPSNIPLSTFASETLPYRAVFP